MISYYPLISRNARARSHKEALDLRYCASSPQEADILVVFGGDGFMLHCLHQYHDLGKPFYGVNCGTVGFLMNPTDHFLIDKIDQAKEAILYPLKAEIQTLFRPDVISCVAINEISILRQTPQTIRLRIGINGATRLSPLVGDGVIISTPAGSTAYNFSAHGPIIPLGVPLLALTPNNPFRPRRWRGALIPSDAEIEIDILSPHTRRAHLVADAKIVPDIVHIRICQDSSVPLRLLFDSGHSLEERVLREQFST